MEIFELFLSKNVRQVSMKLLPSVRGKCCQSSVKSVVKVLSIVRESVVNFLVKSVVSCRPRPHFSQRCHEYQFFSLS